MTPIFITGTGTGIGKTFIAAVITEALKADYWKPVQAGFDEDTDSQTVKKLITNTKTIIHAESYLLKLPASPHIAARKENVEISIDKIISDIPSTSNQLIIEGAGGLMVPLNGKEFVMDLIKKLKAKVVIVSKNYLGSINHSLLTAAVLKANNITVAGWVFNDDYLDYESEICDWTGLPCIASINHQKEINKLSVLNQANEIRNSLQKFINQ